MPTSDNYYLLYSKGKKEDTKKFTDLQLRLKSNFQVFITGTVASCCFGAPELQVLPENFRC